MYLISKTFYGNTYYWNEGNCTWQGLIENSTLLTKTTFDFRMGKFNGYQKQFITSKKVNND